jgi:O-antigen ligase
LGGADRIVRKERRAGLASEPGFLGAMGVFFLAILVYFCKRESVFKRNICAIVLMAVTLIILSKSGTGYVFLVMFAIFVGADQFKIKNVVIYLILGVVSVLFLYQYSGYFGEQGLCCPTVVI